MYVDYETAVSWLLFLTIYALVWNLGVGHSIKLGEPLVSPNCLRSWLLLLGCYSACRVALLSAMLTLLFYCFMTCVQCMLPFVAHLRVLHSVGTWIFRERVFFGTLRPRLLPFHAAILMACFAVSAMYSIVYISDADLKSPDHCRSLVVREAMAMATLSLAAYSVLAFYITCNRVKRT